MKEEDSSEKMSTSAEEKSDHDTMLMQCCASCGTAGGDDIKLMKCTGCYLVKYCGVECQKEHRPKHKKECKKRAAELRMLLRSLNVLKERLEELEKLSMGEEDIQEDNDEEDSEERSTGEKDNQVEKATSEEDLPTETKIEQLKTDLKAKMTALEIKYEGVDLDSCIGCEKARRHIQQKILKKSFEDDGL